MILNDTICALSTPPGAGAIAIVRVSGSEALKIVSSIFKGKNLNKAASHTLHFGRIMDHNEVVDEVVIGLFKTPHSYTGQDTLEISCHGSDYISQYILRLLIQNGCRLATPGEFTQKAFLNGKLDLAQAEAVADLIASDSKAAHQIAINQLKGGFSKKLAILREKLLGLASLIELELDFGEENVEFADRCDLDHVIDQIQTEIQPLVESFEQGNAIKEGIPVAIIGAPNTGKSTLLNALLEEEKAIVSPIAGTTRDTVEDFLFIDGQKFRIIDTAGIRTTNDQIEAIGIDRSRKAMQTARIVLFVFDQSDTYDFVSNLKKETTKQQKCIWIQNKTDLNNQILDEKALAISAKNNEGLALLKRHIRQYATEQPKFDTVVSNLRHYEQLNHCSQALIEVKKGLENRITGDFLAQDLRLALHHLGEITGTISTDEILGNIFGKFCIGK